MKNKEKKSFNSLSYLFPGHIIKEQQFTHRDVKAIKTNLTNSFSNIYLISSIVILVLVISLGIYMNVSTESFVDYYGVMSMVGMITVGSGALICSTLVIVGKTLKKKKTTTLLNHIASDILFVTTAFYMLCCIYSDAEKGFTNNSETLSAGIAFIAVLVLIQPMHWLDASIMDIATSIAIVVLTAYCKKEFNMGAVHYYGLIALIYPFCCYLVVALLFYAESQRYKQALENERLHNNAYYDSLTHCKNRHALSEFLSENKSHWENETDANLLIIMFDIDDFRLYNNQFSHLGGDYCLKSICDAVRLEFRAPNLDFFRYGGEEFLLFFELNDDKEAKNYLERVRLAISRLNIDAPKGAPKKNVTISVGGLFVKNIATFEFEKELQVVDGYLYQAKASGKDVICYNGDIIK